jgi:polyisoprenoid-binding protein YceI
MQAGTQRGLEKVRYVFDAKSSKFTVQAFATGLLSGFGHNPLIAIRDFDGEVQFVPGSYEKIFVRMSVKTSTFEPLGDMKRDDRQKMESMMRDEVLQIEQFPTAFFESTEIKAREIGDGLLDARAAGDLTLHGVTRQHVFDVRVSNMGTMLRASGSFSLLQSDYAISKVSLAGGALRLKDELKLDFEVVARRADT